MKRCPNCQKTFDDAMRFCQTDGTPLVDDAPPADPYKTMVASKEDIQAALSSSQNEQPSAAGIGHRTAPRVRAEHGSVIPPYKLVLTGCP